jgi:hypothetical protein
MNEQGRTRDFLAGKVSGKTYRRCTSAAERDGITSAPRYDLTRRTPSRLQTRGSAHFPKSDGN